MELIKNPNLNFVGNRRLAYTISIIIIAVGLIKFVGAKGLNYGVDVCRRNTSPVVGLTGRWKWNEVREALEGLDLAKSTVQRFSPRRSNPFVLPSSAREEQDEL